MLAGGKIAVARACRAGVCRALQEWKRVLKPGGLTVFSTWRMSEHDLLGLWGAVIQGMVPGDRPGPPAGVIDMGNAEPVLQLLSRLGFSDAKCRCVPRF